MRASADGSETLPDSKSAPRTLTALAVILPALAVVGLGGYLVQKSRPLSVQAASASLTIESDPSGAEVLAAGVRQGTTPLTLAVAPGEHAFEVVSADRRKTVRAQARAGVAVVHHVAFDSRPVDANPAPLPRVPARPAIKTPPASKSAAGPVRSGEAAGWLKVKASVPLEIREGNEVIGTSRSTRIMMPAGRHELQLANEALGIIERRVVRLLPGNTESITIEVPKAPLSINAMPWAEVWVDGTRVGDTPIGNHLVSVGVHDVVFRHPEFGERRQTVTVSLKGPARVSADMRKPQ